jgi:hypothetical protein
MADSIVVDLPTHLPNAKQPFDKTITEWVDEYMQHKDVKRMISVIRQKYPSIPMLKKTLSSMRTKMLQTNKRHSAYSMAFRSWLGKNAQLAKDYDKTIRDFVALTLTEQVNVTKAVRTLQGRGGITTWSGSAELDNFIANELPLVPEYVWKLRMNQALQLGYLRLKEQSLVEKHQHCFRLDNSMQVMEMMRSIINDPKSNKNLLACALLLACGRRTVEVLARCQFMPLHNHTHGAIVIGLTKSRHLAVIEEQVLRIPLLLPFAEFKKGLACLREKMFGKKTSPDDYPNNDALSRRYASQLNKALKEWFQRVDVHVHMLRAIYATLCHSLFQPHNYSLTAFINQTLGHSTISLASHYSSISCLGVTEGALHQGFKPQEVFQRAC